MARIHVLHIPKRGGSALHAALALITHTHAMMLHEHLTRLATIPYGEKVIFSIREPMRRLVSGFNTRLRRALNNNEWSLLEEKAFANFPTPNAVRRAFPILI